MEKRIYVQGRQAHLPAALKFFRSAEAVGGDDLYPHLAVFHLGDDSLRKQCVIHVG